ncbi:MAG: GNAT family N-acetyltransferase [Acidimicrobiales bacterium]
MDFHVDRVPASATWALRQAVLRPHEAIDRLALPDDDFPATASFAVIGDGGEIIGTVRVAPGGPPPPVDTGVPAGTFPWRIRGMATRQDLRNAGIGTELLGRAVGHVADNGGGLLWCNARLPALNLYRRGGFTEHGDPWVDPDIGPHVVMWRLVQPARSGPDPAPSP